MFINCTKATSDTTYGSESHYQTFKLPTDRKADGPVVNFHVLQHLLQRVGRPGLQLSGRLGRRSPSLIGPEGTQTTSGGRSQGD